MKNVTIILSRIEVNSETYEKRDLMSELYLSKTIQEIYLSTASGLLDHLSIQEVGVHILNFFLGRTNKFRLQKKKKKIRGYKKMKLLTS